jgi:hypothetical protein
MRQMPSIYMFLMKNYFNVFSPSFRRVLVGTLNAIWPILRTTARVILYESNKVTPKFSLKQHGDESMKTRMGQLDKALRKAVSISPVVVANAGGTALETEAHSAEEATLGSVEAIQMTAAEGDLEAMYWLVMMHIEGEKHR